VTATTEVAGRLPLGERRGRWVLAVAVLGSGVAQLEATVVNVALPTIGRDLGASMAGLQWTLNGYLVALAALILLGGALGDRLGRRRVFVVGVVWFTVASALCALAPSIEALVAARVLQGIGGALLTPGSLAILEAVLRPEDRARAIGAWSALGGVAAAVGPLVGGWLVEAASWRWVFVINLPLGAFVVWAALRHVPETRDPSARGRLDVRGALLATIALGGLTIALIEARSGVPALVAGLAGLAALLAFGAAERRAPAPLLPPDIFASAQFSAANGVTFVVYAALGGVFFLLVVVLQTALGYSPVAAGAATLPITGLMLALSSRAGALAQRIGPRWPLTAGPLLIAGGMLLMLRIDPGDGYLATVLPAILVFGLGLATTVAPVTATALAAADERHAGAASGVNNAVARTAQLVAIAVLPVLVGLSGAAYRDPQALTDAFHSAMLITAAVAASGGLLALATIRDDVLHRGRTEAPEPDGAAGRPTLHCGVAGPPQRPIARQEAGAR
jgi:EmrB/QacA subfamily drug resistance transporter